MGHLDSLGLPKSGAHDASDRVPAKSRFQPWLLLFLLGLLVIGWWYFHRVRPNSPAQDAAAGSASAPARGKGGAGGNFVVPVVVAQAQRADLPVYFDGLGTVTAFNTVTVRSRVDGQLVRVEFKEGQFVHQGDLLAEIDPRPFQVQLQQAEGQLAKDQAQRRDAEVNFERSKLLFQEGIIPKQQLDTQQAQVGQFEGALESDTAQINSAKLQLTYSRITAPISGRIGLRLVDAGNIVHATDPSGLLVITQLQPISVIFSLPQDQLPQVNAKLRAGVQLTVDAYDRDNTAKIATGKLATIDNQIDTTTGTYKLKSIFTNENNILFPNQFVNVHLLVDTKKDLTVIPVAAIQRGPQGNYVYVVENGNTAKIYNVVIAQTTGNSVGVNSGVNPGDVVVIDGLDKLQDGTKVNPSSASPDGNAPAPGSGTLPASPPRKRGPSSNAPAAPPSGQSQ